MAGQDLNFDLITYHYYLGFNAFSDRLRLDFFPASYQGYQSSLPFVLLYWLDHNGIPPVVNAALHATLHSLNLLFLFLIARLLIGDPTRQGTMIAVSLWLLGAIAPVYWSVVGTSFPDLLTSVPVLCALWLMTRAIASEDRGRSVRMWHIVGGVALLGAAAGMRLHNIIYVVAALCTLAAAPAADAKTRFREVSAYSVVAFVACGTFFIPHAYRLYMEFGNPVFPLYNAWFLSEYFPASNLPISSFTPKTLPDLLMLPFRIATHAHEVYGEIRLPDVRPALLTAALLACFIQWLLQRARSVKDAAAPSEVSQLVDTALIRRFVLIFFLISTLLWIATSTNGRYGVALFLLAGPVSGMLLLRLLPTRYVLLIVAAVLLWQLVLQQLFFRQYRPPLTPWTSRYFDWDIDERLAREPATFLAFGYKTASVLAPRVHPASAHINLMGQYTPAIDAPGSERIRKALNGSGDRLYAVFDLSLILRHLSTPDDIKAYFAGHLRLWGLDFASQSCGTIKLKPPAGQWLALNHLVRAQRISDFSGYIVCRLQPSAAADRERALEQWRNFRGKLLRLGAACPQYFDKPLTYVRVHGSWTVVSLASFEVRFDFHDGGPFYLQLARAPYTALELGREEGERFIADEPDCRKWFSRLMELSSQAARSRRAQTSK